MDPIKNPFSPGAGAPPPELVGRERILEQADILIGRIKVNLPEKSLMLTGLRGVGKTVLLNRIERHSRAAGYQTIFLEAREDKSLGQILAPELKRVLFELDSSASIKDKVRRGLLALKNFALTVKLGDFGIELEPFRGLADSGDIEADLPTVLLALAEAADEQKTPVAIFIDEIQYFGEKELSALIIAMHRIQQKALPVFLVGAGLPVLPALAGNSKSYAERLFSFPKIGALNYGEAARALSEPMRKCGVELSPDAIRGIFELTEGYPYFLQEWGYQAWNQATESPIEAEIVEKATATVVARLDENFFRVRFDRLTNSEKKFLRAMAETPNRGNAPQKTGDLARRLGKKNTSLAPVRAALIRKGMIYSPAYGEIDFTVPLFGDFMKRAMPTPA